MSSSPSQTGSHRRHDVVIRGAGIVGQTLALLLARDRLKVALVSPPRPAATGPDVRAYAINSAARALLQDYRALLLELLDRGIAAGRLAPGLDREAAATAFVGLIQGLVMQTMLGGAPAAAAMPLAAERVLALYRQMLEAAR